MSEIICSYTFNENSGYFFVDTNVSFRQFTDFVTANIVRNDEFVIRNSETNEIVQTDDQLQQLLASEEAVNVLITSSAEESVAPVVEEPKETLIGPITQSILDRLNIQLDENLNPGEMLKALPFPFSMIIQSKIDVLCNNENELAELVRVAASMFSVSYEELLMEAKNSIAIINNRMNPEPQPEEAPKEQPQPEEEDKNETEFIGPLTRSILERLGIEIDESLDPREMLQALPFPFSVIAQAKLDLLCNEPDALQEIVRTVSMCTGVSFEDLLAEATTTAKILREKLHPEEQPKAEESQKQEEPQKEHPVVHPATCDHCQETIVGIRYKCLHCDDYDLCFACEEIQATEHFHDEQHVFAKMYKSEHNRGRNFIRGFHPRRQFFFPGHILRAHQNAGECPQRRNAKMERINKLEESVQLLQEQIRQLQQ